MSFFSTRGKSCVTASQAILQGIAPDGGLYVPAMFPAVPPERLTSLIGMSYEERAVVILKRFLEDFDLREIEEAVNAAYSRERFTHPKVAPVRKLDSSTWALELFHGPTLAFKDIALQLLPHLLGSPPGKTGRTGRYASLWPPAATRERRPWRDSGTCREPAAPCSTPWTGSATCRSCRW